jgi:hypothetical protein
MAARMTLTVEVLFDLREDGGLRAWSPSIPELVLSHADPAQVLADVPRVLETILSDRYGGQVRVNSERDPSAIIEEIRAASSVCKGHAASSHEFTARAA